MSSENSFIELPRLNNINHNRVLSSQMISPNISIQDEKILEEKEKDTSIIGGESRIKSTSATNLRNNSAILSLKHYSPKYCPDLNNNMISIDKIFLTGNNKKRLLKMKNNFSTKNCLRKRSGVISHSSSVNEFDFIINKSHIDMAHEENIQLCLFFAHKLPWIKFNQPLTDNELKEVNNLKLRLNYASSPFFNNTPFYKYASLNKSSSTQSNELNNFPINNNASINNNINHNNINIKLLNSISLQYGNKKINRFFIPTRINSNKNNDINRKIYISPNKRKKEASLFEIEEYKNILKKINQKKGIDKEVDKIPKKIINVDNLKREDFYKDVLERELRLILNNQRNIFIKDLIQKQKNKEKVIQNQLNLNKFIRCISVNKKPTNNFIDGYSILEGKNKQSEEYNNILGNHLYSKEQKLEKLIKYFRSIDEYEDKRKNNIEKLLKADNKYRQLFIPNIDLNKEKLENIKNQNDELRENINTYKLFKNSKIIRKYKRKRK